MLCAYTYSKTLTVLLDSVVTFTWPKVKEVSY